MRHDFDGLHLLRPDRLSIHVDPSKHGSNSTACQDLLRFSILVQLLAEQGRDEEDEPREWIHVAGDHRLEFAQLVQHRNARRAVLAAAAACRAKGVLRNNWLEAPVTAAERLDRLSFRTDFLAPGEIDALGRICNEIEFDSTLYTMQARQVTGEAATPTATAERATVPPMAVDEPRKVKGKRVNARMMEQIAKSGECLKWSAQRWADFIGCSKTTVIRTHAWRVALPDKRSKIPTPQFLNDFNLRRKHRARRTAAG